MKLFFSEFKPDYNKYFFPYQVWLYKEENDDIDVIYQNGFLPIRSNKNVYYLSRSVRIDLSIFEPSSENRRILRKTENFQMELIPLNDFVYNSKVQKLCKQYTDQKFGKETLSNTAIQNIFRSGVCNYIFICKNKDRTEDVGYAVCNIADNFLQFAHSFYDMNFFIDNIGMGIMLTAIIWAKENKKRYAYLGTCYDEKALYKTEFLGFEFFNGFKWSNNLDELKALIKQWKENLKNQQYLLKRKDYIEQFYEGDLSNILNYNGVRVNLL